MTKLTLKHPTLIMAYGYPGVGKTYFARQLCEDINAAHIQGDRIRYELFEEPRYDKQENDIVAHLMNYMAEEFLAAGVSVVYDANAYRLNQRREMRELARKAKAHSLLVWLQIDPESAFARVSRRDRRKTDDKFSPPIDEKVFRNIARSMQNPVPTEDYVVLSGKHTYQTQRSSFLKRLYDHHLLQTQETTTKIAKPGMVNLIPTSHAGRVDQTRRNIIIR